MRRFRIRFRQCSKCVLGALAIVVAAAEADAAVIRDVRAISAARATRIVVEIDGEFHYRARASEDGAAVIVEIERATIHASAPRMLPVSDPRVDGVILHPDDDLRSVRIAVDISGRVAPRLDANADGSRLILSFTDAPAGVPSPGPAISDGTNGASVEVASDSPSPRASRSPRSGPVKDPSSKIAPVRAPVAREPDRPQPARQGTAIARPAEEIATADATRTAPNPGNVAVAASPAKSVLEKPVVILDPGHGGKDPGARAWTGELEKDIVLDLAQRVARRLRNRGDIEVVMTRSGDEYVELADRRDTSRRWNADAFVSIHANASHSTAARGIETYYHSRITAGSAKEHHGDREIRRLARVENGGKASRQRSDAKGISRTSLPAGNLPAMNRRPESMRLAHLVQRELVRRLGMRYEAVRDLGAKEGPFFVIGSNAAPSVLVEAAFLTHREEGLRMRSEVYREQIADGVARGIVLFLEQQRQAGTL